MTGGARYWAGMLMLLAAEGSTVVVTDIQDDAVQLSSQRSKQPVLGVVPSSRRHL